MGGWGRLGEIRAAVILGAIAIVACHAAPAVRTPYLQNVGPDRATILWTSSERVGAEVRYSETGDLTRSQPATVRALAASPGQPVVYQYRVDLRNLSANREYFYQVVAGGQVVTEDGRFRTAGPGPVRFLVFGDSGTGSDAQLALARRMAETEHPSLVLHTGDVSQESGTPEQLDANYLKVYAPLMEHAPFFATPGNHDYYTDAGKPCLAIHAPPSESVPAEDDGLYYSFDWGNVHFISLNSNLMEYRDAAERMIAWLERDLSAQKNFWKVVYFHHTPYPTGHHASDPVSTQMRERIVPVLERHGVQVVFSGHEHSYQRTFPLKNGLPAESGGTVYITTGGGGGVLHYINPGERHAIGKSVHHYIRAEVRGARMTLTVIGTEGETVDFVTLTAEAKPVVEAVVNAGSFGPAIAAGSLVSIFGRDLAVAERSPATPAMELAGTRITLDGEALPLLYAAPDQINAQLPYSFTGPGILRVHTRSSTEEVPVEVRAAAPAILQVPRSFRNWPAVWSERTRAVVTRSAPAQPGDIVTIFLIGLGAIEGSLRAGDRAPLDRTLATLHPVRVRIGGRTVMPSFAGLTPGFTGLYQVNAMIPPDLPAGPAALRVIVDGAVSDPATVFVATDQGNYAANGVAEAHSHHQSVRMTR